MQPQPDATSRKRILLVEDERAVRETLRALISSESHAVVEANNGAEAFALLLSAKFDLVVTDFEMPFVKGDELAAKIKRAAPGQPVLMLTAYGRTRCAANPVDAVLNKPFEVVALKQAMNRLLAKAA